MELLDFLSKAHEAKVKRVGKKYEKYLSKAREEISFEDVPKCFSYDEGNDEGASMAADEMADEIARNRRRSLFCDILFLIAAIVAFIIMLCCSKDSVLFFAYMLIAIDAGYFLTMLAARITEDHYIKMAAEHQVMTELLRAHRNSSH